MPAAHGMMERKKLSQQFLDELAAVFGDRLKLSEAVRSQHGQSETHYGTILPDAVVYPHSTEEVVALIKACLVHEIPVIPFGAGTSLEGNTLAVRGV